MRALPILVAAILLAGCAERGDIRCVNPHPAGTDCSYGYGDTTAQVGFPVWDAQAAGAGVQAAQKVAAGATIRVDPTANGSTLSVTWPHDHNRLGLTEEEAQRGGQPDHEPILNATLAAFEGATGWRHAGNVTWLASMSVA